MDLSALIEMSRKYGADPDYVLAGGGNTSYKENNVLAVKASGTALSSIDENGFVMMDTEKLLDMVRKEYPENDKEREALALKDMMDARLDKEDEKRPSVECILHALFPQKYVLHVHPALINGLTCGKDGAASAAGLFGDKQEDLLWVPLTKPGYILSKVNADMMSDHVQRFGKYPSIVLLQNHGIFVAADDACEIDLIMEDVVNRIGSRIARSPDFCCDETDNPEPEDAGAVAVTETLEKIYGGSAIFLLNNEIASLAKSRETFSKINKPFTPDHIVYCRAYPLFVTSEDDLTEAFAGYDSAYGGKPKVVTVQGLGAFALGRDANEAGIVSALYIDTIKIAVYSESFGGPLALPEEFVDFIVNWESESYRQKQSQ